jgi:hypothetical protein
MNNAPIIFNRSILGRYLDSFQIENIADYREKYDQIQKWKKSDGGVRR